MLVPGPGILAVVSFAAQAGFPSFVRLTPGSTAGLNSQHHPALPITWAMSEDMGKSLSFAQEATAFPPYLEDTHRPASLY
jgi:hypothetical protein